MPDVSTPKVSPALNGLQLDWQVEHIQCDVTQIYQHHDGCVACEIHLSTSAPGFNPHLLRHHVADLANANGRDRLAALLKRSYNHVEWEDIVEGICEHTLAFLRRPPELQTTIDFEQAKPPEFVLHPFLVRHENNMLFGPGGGGKSYLALYWLILLEAHPELNTNWIIRPGKFSVLYLDWERSKSSQSYRMRQLLRGLELPDSCPDTPLHYHRVPGMAMAEYVNQTQHLINQAQANMLIIDSAGPAAGGKDLNQTGPVIDYFHALGKLKSADGSPLTVLTLAHLAKNLDTNRHSPYGNVYWRNESSSVWEIIPTESPEHNISQFTLRCEKHNDYAWIPDSGIQMTFPPPGDELGEGVRLTPLDTHKMEMKESRANWIILYEALSSASEIKEIASLTGLDYRLCANGLRDMLKVGYAIKIAYGRWGQGKEIEEF